MRRFVEITPESTTLSDFPLQRCQILCDNLRLGRDAIFSSHNPGWVNDDENRIGQRTGSADDTRHTETGENQFQLSRVIGAEDTPRKWRRGQLPLERCKVRWCGRRSDNPDQLELLRRQISRECGRDCSTPCATALITLRWSKSDNKRAPSQGIARDGLPSGVVETKARSESQSREDLWGGYRAPHDGERGCQENRDQREAANHHTDTSAMPSSQTPDTWRATRLSQVASRGGGTGGFTVLPVGRA